MYISGQLEEKKLIHHPWLSQVFQGSKMHFKVYSTMVIELIDQTAYLPTSYFCGFNTNLLSCDMPINAHGLPGHFFRAQALEGNAHFPKCGQWAFPGT